MWNRRPAEHRSNVVAVLLVRQDVELLIRLIPHAIVAYLVV